jgi:hypothetical protein
MSIDIVASRISIPWCLANPACLALSRLLVEVSVQGGATERMLCARPPRFIRWTPTRLLKVKQELAAKGKAKEEAKPKSSSTGKSRNAA